MTIYTLETAWKKPPFSLNDPTPISRRSNFYRARLRREAKDHVWNLAHAAKIPPLRKATITVVWTASVRRRRDDDNLGPTNKVIGDALTGITSKGVKLPGILPDDTTDIVTWGKPIITVKKGIDTVHIVIEGELA